MPHHHHIKTPLCSALILVKNTNSDNPKLKQIYPKEFDFQKIALYHSYLFLIQQHIIVQLLIFKKMRNITLL